MARTRLNGSIRNVTHTRILDESGEEIYATEHVEETRHDPRNGSVNTVKRGRSTTLSSGEVYHVGMSAGQRPVMLTGVCELCRVRLSLRRRRRTHGLTNVKHLKRCSRCGRAVCPRHRKRSRFDRRWRCIRCHRWHRLKCALLWMLFREEE